MPDVIAVQGKFRGSYPTTAPELCIEILSPGDTLPKALDKGKLYLDWGSQTVWIIDPEKRTAWTLSQERVTEPTWISPAGLLKVGATSIALHELFAEVDRKLEVTEN